LTAAPSLLADLAAALPGDLARFTAGLAGPADPRAGTRADALLDGAMLADIVARFEARFGATDRRAIVSMWASIYFAAALPPLLAANILLGVEPQLGLDHVAFIVARNFRIDALRIGQGVRRLADAEADTRFDRLILGHLAPFIDLVAERGGVTRRLLWSNAGNVFEAFCRRLEGVATQGAALDHARDLLARPILVGGERNPLFEPVRYVADRRVRRLCCLRYLIPQRTVCGVCPLAVDHPARARDGGGA
jgi:ferric iron reductase protein FhuF